MKKKPAGWGRRNWKDIVVGFEEAHTGDRAKSESTAKMRQAEATDEMNLIRGTERNTCRLNPDRTKRRKLDRPRVYDRLSKRQTAERVEGDYTA